jgi:hypothetical protein
MICYENSACYGIVYCDCADMNAGGGWFLCYHSNMMASHYHQSLACYRPPASGGNDKGGSIPGLVGITIEDGQELVLRAPDREKTPNLFLTTTDDTKPSNIRLDSGEGLISQIVNVQTGQTKWRFIPQEVTPTSDGFTMKLQSKVVGANGFLCVQEDGFIAATCNQDDATVFTAKVVQAIGTILTANGYPVYAQPGQGGALYLHADQPNKNPDTFFLYVEALAPKQPAA